MPKNDYTATVTGFEKRIREARPELGRRLARKLAERINRRMDYYTRFVDLPVESVYEEGLRILGIMSDPTARDAVRNIEREAAAA